MRQPRALLLLLLLLAPSQLLLAVVAPTKCRNDLGVPALAREAPVVLEAKIHTLDQQPPKKAELLLTKVFKGQQQVNKILKVRKAAAAASSAAEQTSKLKLSLEECGVPGSELKIGDSYVVFAEVHRRQLVALRRPERATKQIVRNVQKATRSSQPPSSKKKNVLNITGSDHAQVALEKELKLQCNATGRGLSKIEWYKDGRRLHSGKKLKIKSRKRSSQLLVKVLKKDDVGVYECRSTTTRGDILSHKTNITLSPKSLASGQECKYPERDSLCMNGGTCRFYQFASTSGEFACECADGYRGHRCADKAIGDLANVHGEALGIDVSTRMLSLYWGK